ncbi:MAG: hypothetical protein IIA61_09035 [Candidatus Marinimicrobia bacterium]|nr:hypothetical protein [Candidatus Neomarinimicrobiota bacterium]
MEVKSINEKDHLRVEITGIVSNASDCNKVFEITYELIEKHDLPIVIDMSHATFVASIFLGSLVRSFKMAIEKGNRFGMISSPNRACIEVITGTKFQDGLELKEPA